MRYFTNPYAGPNGEVINMGSFPTASDSAKKAFEMIEECFKVMKMVGLANNKVDIYL